MRFTVSCAMALALAGCSVNFFQPSIGSGNKVNTQVTAQVNARASSRPSIDASSPRPQLQTPDGREEPPGELSVAPATQSPLPPQSSARWVVQSSGTSEDLLALCVVDDMTAYAVGKMSTIVKTTDGGRTWRPAGWANGRNTDLTSVWFTDAFHGWVGTSDGTLFHTDDGGETWNIQFTNPERNFQDQPWAFASIRFLTPLTGYAAGRNLYKTTDGGDTWTLEPTGCGAGDLDTHQGTILATGESCATVRSDGAGWERIAGTDNLGAMAVVSLTEAWSLRSVPYGPYVSQTTDGGATWNQVNLGRKGGEKIHLADTNLGGIDFVDSSHGWLINMRAIISTEDGGKTWKSVEVASSGILTAIQMLDTKHGFAVGTEGRVVRYTTE